jgi:phenylpropionate dioxygenase-like ring-hydroxylating dioxygenase large terminal subunit
MVEIAPETGSEQAGSRQGPGPGARESIAPKASSAHQGLSFKAYQPQEALRVPRQKVYTDPAIYEAELQRIFDQDWVMVGRQGTIPNPGDYMTVKVGKKPVVCIRQKDGAIRAFGNFCLHRYARLLDGRGKTGRIVCPYHAWTYDITGQLIGITDPQGFGCTAKSDIRLVELACEVWLGFVFVSVRSDLPSVASRLGPLAIHLANYGLETYEDRYTIDEEMWDGNWKLVYENFVESYHLTYAHTQSIGPSNPTRLVELGPMGHRQFSLHYNPYRPEDLPEVHNPALSEDERRWFLVVGIYPNTLIGMDANFLWWIMLEPHGIDRTNFRWGLSFTPHALNGMNDPDTYTESIRELFDTAIVEDKAMVARVQEGSAFGAQERGYLHSTLEIYVDEFRQYVDRMLASRPQRVAGNNGEERPLQ